MESSPSSDTIRLKAAYLLRDNTRCVISNTYCMSQSDKLVQSGLRNILTGVTGAVYILPASLGDLSEAGVKLFLLLMRLIAHYYNPVLEYSRDLGCVVSVLPKDLFQCQPLCIYDP